MAKKRVIHTFRIKLHKNSNTNIYIGQKEKLLSMITTLNIHNSEGSTNLNHMYNLGNPKVTKI